MATTYRIERGQHIAAPAAVVLERVLDLRRPSVVPPWGCHTDAG